MEIWLFYALAGALVAFFRFTTATQRKRLAHSGWTLLVIGFVVGFAWELIH